jgi:hypothetical protein
MAPITDQDVADLKSLVAKLEARVAELEGKASGAKAGGSSTGLKASASERMRLVLMGPPGAGTCLCYNVQGH